MPEHVPARHFRQLQTCVDVLREQSSVWPRADTTPLRWDQHRGVFAGPEADATYRMLFGSGLVHRAYRYLNVLRRKRPTELFQRWSEAFSIDAPLPPDVVLIPLGAFEGVVAISASAGRVLKVVYGERSVEHVQNELAAWSLVQDAGLERHVPAIFDAAASTGGLRWMESALAPNTNPFIPQLRGAWRRWLRRTGLPTLQQFYEATGVDHVDASEALDRETERLYLEDAPKAFHALAVLAREVRPGDDVPPLVRTTIHSDLFMDHVHRHGDDWWIIDWGQMRRAALHTELLIRYFLNPTAPDDFFRGFWLWLRGEIRYDDLPRETHDDISLLLDWQHDWQGFDVRPEDLRFHILVDRLTTLREELSARDLETLPPLHELARAGHDQPLAARQLAVLSV